MSEKKSKRKMKAPGLSIRTSEDKQPLNRSYSLTKSGVFHSEKGFTIDSKGIQESPATFGAQRRQFIVNDLEELEIGAVIGHGAGGVVNRAVHKPTGMVVAVKSIDVLNDDTRRQMMRELKILYEHEGDHIVQFHGAFYDDCHINVVLEYMNAGSLADLFRRSGRFPESVVSDFAAQIVHGLHYLHRERHQVHRDVKPANILCDQQGRVRLSDFGVAKDLTSTLEECETFLGTARYMAPETLGGKPYSYPADIWALGICLVEFATGRYPYDSFKSHWELLDAMQTQPLPHLPDDGDYSEEFRDFVRRCLQVDPDARGQIGELAAHAFVNQTLSAIMKQQTVDWIREQIERYQANKGQRRSGGGTEPAAKEVLEEVGECRDYGEDSFEDYNSPHASTSPDGLQVEFPFQLGEASDDLVQFDAGANGMQPEPQPAGVDEDFQPVLHPRNARRTAAGAAHSSDIDELMQSKEGLYALRASLEVLDLESDAMSAAGPKSSAQPPSTSRPADQPTAASHPLNSMQMHDEVEVDVEVEPGEEINEEDEVVESCLSPTPPLGADDHGLLPERVSIPPTKVMMSPAMPRSRRSSREVRETRPLSSSSFRGSSRGSQGSELDSAELAASVAMAVQNENAGHMSSRGETPPILAHALKSGLGATRPSPASTPKRMTMAYKRGKSPGGQGMLNSITTPRSPAFEEYRQQVDTLTNQIRSQLSQTEQAELREQVLSQLAHLDEGATQGNDADRVPMG